MNLLCILSIMYIFNVVSQIHDLRRSLDGK
jgi:hypothetical protein